MDHLIHDKTLKGFYENIRGDLRYALLLIVCVLVSTFFRHFVSASVRIKVDGIIGLAINLYVSGWTVLYSLVVVMAHLALYQLVPNPK